jgi:hypothetical protein
MTMTMKHLIFIIIGILTFSCIPNEEKIKLNDNQISKLDSLKKSELYADSEWDKRGLIPSEKEKVEQMKLLTNECLDKIIEESRDYQTKSNYKKVLENGLRRFNKSDFDTEEKEFIADKFYEISLILDVDFKEQLNVWLYGRVMIMLQKLFETKDIAIRTNEVNCTKCNILLKELIIREENNIPEYWIIVKCNDCGKHNFLPRQKNIKEVRYENCVFVKSLSSVENDSSKILEIIDELEKTK